MKIVTSNNICLGNGRIYETNAKSINVSMSNVMKNASILVNLIGVLVLFFIVWGCASPGQKIWRGNGGTPLHEAVYTGNTSEIRSRLNPTSLSSQDDAGNTPLHWAVANGNLGVTKILLDGGADIDALNNDGDAPVHLVARFGHLEVAEYLFEFNDTLKNSQNESGFAPLHIAALYGQTDFITMLFEQNVDKTIISKKRFGPLHTAIHSYDPVTVQLLLDNDIEIDQRDNFGNTPFQHAVLINNIEFAKLLVANGAKLNHKNNEGNNALHLISSSTLTKKYLRNLRNLEPKSDTERQSAVSELLQASFSTNFEMYQWLVSEDIDINSNNRLNRTPLQTAVLANNIAFIRQISNGGADIEHQDASGNTSIHLAVIEDLGVIVEYLARLKARVDTANFSGDLPIHSASLSASPEVIEILIDYGADITKRNNSGRSPIHLAVYSQNLQTAETLIKQGADVEIPDSNNNTPLHYVAYAGLTTELNIDSSSSLDSQTQGNQTDDQTRDGTDVVDMIDLLLKSGANINAQDNEGNTPLHSATLIGQITTIESLLLAGADPTITNNSGQTPLQLAEKFGRTDVARVLRKYYTN